MIYTGAVVSALASLIASRWFAPIAGDAARYFSPDPDNVEARQKIRLAGIQVIEKLTASKAYDRIIVVEIGRAHVELQSLMRISYAVFCLKKKKTHNNKHYTYTPTKSVNKK